MRFVVTEFSPGRGRMLLRIAAMSLIATVVACGDEDPVASAGGTEDAIQVDAGGDIGVVDIGTTDAGRDLPPAGEPLLITFTREATSLDGGLPDYVQVMVVDETCRPPNVELCDPGSCEPIEIAPRNASEPLCNNGCRISSDLSWIVFLDPEEARTLRKAPIGPDYQLTADSSIVATEVADYAVEQRTVAYRVGDDLHVHELDSGADRVVAAFAGAGRGAFHLSGDATRLFVNNVATLTAMDVDVIDLATDNLTRVHHFVSGEEQGTGSFYSGREPMAVSPDGGHLAVVTNARTSRSLCNSNADCVDPGYTCLSSAAPPRCVRQELTLNLINLSATDRLDLPCSSDAECGDAHLCDLTALDGEGQGRCIPGRFELGPSGPTACQFLAPGQYANIRGELGWRTEESVVALLAQDCTSGNIPVTDVVALNLFAGAAVERIIENPSQNHGGESCWDPVEECWSPADCFIEISDMAVSETGNTVALVGDSISSAFKDELWIADGYGRGEMDLMSRSIDWDVLSVQVHPRE